MLLCRPAETLPSPNTHKRPHVKVTMACSEPRSCGLESLAQGHSTGKNYGPGTILFVRGHSRSPLAEAFAGSEMHAAALRGSTCGINASCLESLYLMSTDAPASCKVKWRACGPVRGVTRPGQAQEARSRRTKAEAKNCSVEVNGRGQN